MASDILIVDDEADICELVAGILQDEGHGTRTARDSDEALAAVVTGPISFSSTFGCRAASSTVFNCSIASSRSIPNCRS